MEFLGSILMLVMGWLGIGDMPAADLAAEEARAQAATEAVVDRTIGDAVQEATHRASSSGNNASNTTIMAGDTASNETTAVDMNNENVKTMMVAGGCFWCVEADLEKVPGVIQVVSGYAGGTTENPNYDNYGAGGHREVVEVTYDANKVSYEDILIVTMKTTDPTDDNGTFADRGDKYSAAFYYETEAEREVIENLIAEVDANGPYTKPLAIDVEERPTFWKAEDFHQDYYKGTLSALKYKFYRNASGRDDFIEKHWGQNDHSTELPWRTTSADGTTSESVSTNEPGFWQDYQKPASDVVRAQLSEVAYRVTQEDGTERAGTSPLDKNYERGIYVDVLSGEPLFSSRDKFDSGTGWPSFTRPITKAAVTEHDDRKLFVVRTEVRSAIADNHLGHVFTDGPRDGTGLRYCMNGVALEFVPEADMVERGYADYVQYL